MAWLPGYTHRMPFPAHNATPTSPIDVECEVFSEDARVWNNVESDGHDVRFTRGDGITELGHYRQTWDFSGRSAIFQLDDVTFPDPAIADGTDIVWMYFGNAGVADVSSSFTIGAKIGGDPFAGNPLTTPYVIVTAQAQAPDDTEPAQIVVMTTSTEMLVWFDMSQLLYKVEGDDETNSGETILHFRHVIEDGGTPLGGGHFDNQFNRIYETLDGRILLGCHVDADGTDGDLYTMIVTAYTGGANGTTVERVLSARCLILKQDPDDN